VTNLTELANRLRSDKGTICSHKHKYTYIYDLIFWAYRDAPVHFLELGLAVGGPESPDGMLDRTVDSPSIAMWLAYFRQATIHGFDISDFSHVRHDRFTFMRGDAGIERDLCALAESTSHFDIVVDDASHASYHQQLAFKVLWERLAGDGLYIIEDLHWQSSVYEAAMPGVPLTRDFLVAWFEPGEYLPHPLFSHDDMRRLSSQVASFAAFPAFNDGTDAIERRPDNSAKLIVIRKRA